MCDINKHVVVEYTCRSKSRLPPLPPGQVCLCIWVLLQFLCTLYVVLHEVLDQTLKVTFYIVSLGRYQIL